MLAATDRVVRPFEWGLDWTAQWPGQTLRGRNVVIATKLARSTQFKPQLNIAKSFSG